MDTAYISALSALAGSAIGALASFATTWLTQTNQDRTQRSSQAMARRERLYGEFIDEASKSFAEAMTHGLDNSGELVKIYAIRSKLKLFASHEVVEAADEVMEKLTALYAADTDFSMLRTMKREDLDILRRFSEACRADLS